MSLVKHLLAAGRPRQWTKNLVVFGAIVFSGRFTEPVLVGKSVLAFVSLCALSSAVYVLNDIHDVERDRQHPRKRQRPLASGAITSGQAWLGFGGYFALALGLGALVGSGYLLGAGLYFLLQGAYSNWLKHVVILDIMSIAAGFVIRAVAGVWAIGVPISPWLLVCAALLALFLASAKRRHEVLLLGGDSDAHRPVLAEYSAELLDQITSTLSAATITAYTLYTFFAHADEGAVWMMLTVPFVVYGVLRYQYLMLTKNEGGAPEEVLLTDKPILATVGAWILASVAILWFT
jgi:4-hydroxybenzoate polyprenyltransferase